MGQNLAIIWSTAPLAEDDGDFPSRIKAWFDEVRKYSFGDPWAPYTGHYSQVRIFIGFLIFELVNNFSFLIIVYSWSGAKRI